MSGLEQTKDEIKKKMQLSDYHTYLREEVNTSLPQKVNTSTRQEVITSIPSSIKMTVYLSQKHCDMFNELCAKEMMKNGKPGKSIVISDAIEVLYNLRKKESNDN